MPWRKSKTDILADNRIIHKKTVHILVRRLGKDGFVLRRFEITLLAGLVLALLITPLTGFAKDSGHLRQGVVRLHILANSDSEADQQLKLAVRDRILAETDELFGNASSGTQALEAARQNLDRIVELAQQEITANGYSYPVLGKVTRLYFTTRVYDDVTLPAGDYDAVQLTIGEGKGHNWWCVMYPPMCIPAAQAKRDYPEEEEIRSLNTRPAYKMGFAVVELAEQVAHYFEREQKPEPQDTDEKQLDNSIILQYD